jgi:hypothetical protein
MWRETLKVGRSGIAPESAAITPVCAVVSLSVPALLVAVTRQRMVAPSSASTSVRVDPVAPLMSTGFAPAASHLIHW